MNSGWMRLANMVVYGVAGGLTPVCLLGTPRSVESWVLIGVAIGIASNVGDWMRQQMVDSALAGPAGVAAKMERMGRIESIMRGAQALAYTTAVERQRDELRGALLGLLLEVSVVIRDCGGKHTALLVIAEQAKDVVASQLPPEEP